MKSIEVIFTNNLKDMRMLDRYKARMIVANGIIVKNAYGPKGIPFSMDAVGTLLKQKRRNYEVREDITLSPGTEARAEVGVAAANPKNR